MTTRTPRTEKLDIRLSKTAKQTLQAAASASRKSVSDFVLESALSEAEERLAERMPGMPSSRPSMRRRVVTQGLSACFANLLFLILSRDEPAAY